MIDKHVVLKHLKNYLVISLSCLLYAVAFCWFYEPNGISVGGFTGISQILNFLMPTLPIGITTIVLNIPLFIIGTKKQGLWLLVSSLYAMTLGSLFIDLIDNFFTFAPMDDLLLASVFGGLLAGVASGLGLKSGTTTGGTELAAKLLKYKFRHVSVGRLCFAIDLMVVVLYALAFKQVNNALYGILSMAILSVAVDTVIYSGGHAKMAYIISGQSEAVKDMLIKKGFGVTMINSQGGWNGDDKQMVLCVFRRQQIAIIKSEVTKIDPDAFVIVCDAHEVLGEGFGRYSVNEL